MIFDSTKVWNYYRDQVGSVRAVTHEGAIIWRGDYKAFGELLTGNEDWTPLKTYALHENDAETGLIYMQQRWYDAETAQFISEDPAMDGLNWYGYGGANPIGMVDPEGLTIVMSNPLGVTGFKNFYDQLKEIYENNETIRSGVDQLSDVSGISTVLSGKDLIENGNTKEKVIGGILVGIGLFEVGCFLSRPGSSTVTGKPKINIESQSISKITAKMPKIEKVSNLKIEVKNSNIISDNGIQKRSESNVNNSAKKVHGNSKLSDKLTTLYKLYTKDGKFLKNGVTSKTNPERRYTKIFMKDKRMDIYDQGSRADMLKKERELTEKDPGPLNKESWAGKLKEK
jgi:RHS repeat-associated protein